MSKKVRVRFAPSPTGGLHIGGVRTLLYNYLFAKQHQGDFVVRIEDTDQNRFVASAEEYIYETLSWCGLQPDESPKHGGAFAPYRQSERKHIYKKYAEQLVENGFAYYAFDTAEELDEMRIRLRTGENPSPQYDQSIRREMRNSLTLSRDEVEQLLRDNTPYVVRIKMPVDEPVSFTDIIRGQVSFNTSLVDDKVLLKADSMPTYHLAVVVDDYLMQITHAFRGEEWLPSAPVHILLWRYLFGEENMPQWLHLPLILGASGKLSKRDAATYGYPVFAMNWADPNSGELTEGFREKGFLPQAFINMLALFGWNDGTDQEIFSLDELIQKFSLQKVHKGGAHFNFEKAKWFNHEWIKRVEVSHLRIEVKKLLQNRGINVSSDEFLERVIGLVKERCTLLTDFYEHSYFFFIAPEEYDVSAIKGKWNDSKKEFFTYLQAELNSLQEWNSAFIENAFKNQATLCNIKTGELQLPFRVMLVGGKFGPPVFDIASVLGKDETINRIRKALHVFE